MNSDCRVQATMTFDEVISAMSEGNPGAIECIALMFLDDPYGTMLDLLLLDSLEIYGSKLYMIWNDCCDRNVKKMKKTLEAFRKGQFSKEEIHKNLSEVYAKPFI